ncbi:MAG TPA: calcium/sodium antiporter [Gammaproteobacteria bacterium]|nr:calcium/sodium antiporter [Gammaproteobacteria bacterium]HIK69177.1 calcium/sodium antiporter [Pseudomonadales bacterium]
MALALAVLTIGLILLVFSADWFIEGAAATAAHLGLPPLLIGLVIIGFGSSAPEMLISALAAFQNNPGLALGNAVGSNITNIALILGITALIKPVPISDEILRREMPILILICGTSCLLIALDGQLQFTDGILLMIGFTGAMAWMIGASLRDKKPQDNPPDAQKYSLIISITLTLLGFLLLLASSRAIVWGGTEIARAFGISDLIIGLTIVAIGTSLPELAATITAVKKSLYDLALGNIIGSNIFNGSIVIGIAALISPTEVEPALIYRDLPIMMFLTITLFIVGTRVVTSSSGIISRKEGLVFITIYLAYNTLLAASLF